MKKWLTLELTVVVFAAILSVISSCSDRTKDAPIKKVSDNGNTPVIAKSRLSKEFKSYWYSSKAEITSYSLEQARYGEIRKGTAVLVYVTEPFNADKQVKADQNDKSNIPVLKLNSTKNYLTGIYPYSIMSSSFYPVYNNQQALKLTFTAQEWCGQVFSQLNNKDMFEVNSYSYFESEGDQQSSIEKDVLENELWNKLRIEPSTLPIGELNIIPSFEYLRLSHKELKSYAAIANLKTTDEVSLYSIEYPELERVLEISFNPSFPFEITGWTETFKSGFGENAKTMVTKATKIKTLRSPYWQQNRNKHLSLRDSLGL